MSQYRLEDIDETVRNASVCVTTSECYVLARRRQKTERPVNVRVQSAIIAFALTAAKDKK